MIAAGLLARKSRRKASPFRRGQDLARSRFTRIITDYYQKSGLLPYLKKLRFNVVGYGSACIGNSVAPRRRLEKSTARPCRRQRALGQPRLRGPRGRTQLPHEPAARGLRARPARPQLRLRTSWGRPGRPPRPPRTVWPTQAEVAELIKHAVSSDGFRKEYATVTSGDASWQGLSFPTGDVYASSCDSTYIRKAPYFDGITATPAPVENIAGARVLAVLGDSVTTDHISPAGSFRPTVPRSYTCESSACSGAVDFNSYGRDAAMTGHGARHVCQHPPAQ